MNGRKPKKVYKIGDRFFRVRYIDSGWLHHEDKGLLRSNIVTWSWDDGFWSCSDDDDWMLSEDGKRIIARETGWDLRRYKHCVEGL